MDCAACQQPTCDEIINFGDLPICHHFLKDDETEATHPAALGQCKFCGLVQMMDPIPPAKLVPRFDWITYNEPEAHLDAVVEMLKKKQAGKAVSKVAPRAPARTGGNVIDLLKRSLEMEKKSGRKSPPLQPAMPKANKKRAKARA